MRQISRFLDKIFEKTNAEQDALPTNPLAELSALEKAYEKRWILSTSQLASILKLNSKTLARQKSFERHGFTFTRCGQVGAEIGWRVGKVELD